MPTHPLALTARAAFAAALVAALVAAATIPAAWAQEAPEAPLGPTIGNVLYVGAVRSADSEADVDTFVAPLIAGERISVCVTARNPADDLQPTVVLVDAVGSVLPVLAVTSRRGKRVVLRGYTATTTGLRGVCVAGHGGTEGGYAARFRVRSPRRWRTARVSLDAAAHPRHAVPFEAVDGARLDARVRSSARGERIEVLRVLAPDGSAVPGLANALRRNGRGRVVSALELGGGAGTYSVLVGVAGGDATGTVKVRVTPPRRPRGRIELAVDEPALRALDAPLPARIGARLALPTRDVPQSPPPQVLLDGVPADVLRVADDGDEVEIRVPEGLSAGALASATLIGPDGQADARPGHVRVVREDVLDLSGWTLVQSASSRHFTFPPGTVLRTGEHAVVARDAERADFAAFWNVPLDPTVRFVRSTADGAAFPSINGSETFTLLDAAGAVVDGPTLPIRSSGHESLARIAGTPPGDLASWILGADDPGVPTPGSGGSLADPPMGVYISEISDTAGSGTFGNEFIELYFAGHATP